MTDTARAMSEENVGRFLEATEAFNRGDIEAWLEGYATDAVFEPQVAVMEGTYVGHDRMRAFVTDVADTFEVLQLQFDDVRDLGDRVLALGTARGIGKGSGIEGKMPLAIVVSFRNGRIVHLKDYGEEQQALEAAGLSE
jgi:ketosteroid isomerase-like protein